MTASYKVLLIGLVTWHVTSSDAMAVTRYRKSAESSDPSPVILKDSVNVFPSKLFKEIAKTKPDDFVWSPISATMVLSMAALGAKSSTGQQLRTALRISNDREFAAYLARIRVWLDELAIYDQVDLRLAHKMFITNRFQLKGDFVEMLKQIFLSEAEIVDFNNAEAALTTINEWGAGQTSERFESLLSAGDINSKTSIVFLNVGYFRGSWSTPFPASETKPREFWIHGTTPEHPLTMYRFGRYRHGELTDMDAKFIEIPYVSKSDLDAVSMFIILPNQRNGMATLKNNLDKITPDRLHTGTSSLVHFYLPKFKIESSIDLAGPLSELAVNEMFDRTADFRGMSAGRRLKVSKIVQKSGIEVEEGGTEAVVSSMVLVSDDVTSTTPEPSVEFKVDHPFVCTIVTQTGVTLFSAIVSSRTGFEVYRPTCYDYPAP